MDAQEHSRSCGHEVNFVEAMKISVLQEFMEKTRDDDLKAIYRNQLDKLDLSRFSKEEENISSQVEGRFLDNLLDKHQRSHFLQHDIKGVNKPIN